MAVLKIRDPADPTGATWLDISGTGATGPAGGPVPTGGNPGEVITKTGAGDFEVGWAAAGRGFVAQLPDPINFGASVPGGAVNTWTNILTGSITIDPARRYQIYAGIRAIADAGADANCNIAMTAGSSGIFDDYFTTTGANVGLWGAWCQQIVIPGTTINTTAAPAAVDFVLKTKVSIANLAVYLPRITVIDVGQV